MPNELDFLSPYLGGGGQMSGGGMGGSPLSPGQPTAGGGFDWKRLLAPALGAIGSGLLGGKEGVGSFASGFADSMHQNIQRKRQQEFETNKAIGDQAHKMWQELQGADLSKLPPNLAHLGQKKAEFDQKYAQAIMKDGIDAKEAAELLSIGTVLKGAMPEVGRFREDVLKAQPFTAGISSGTLPPPPGAEALAEQGLDNDLAASMAGIEAMRASELARAQYETPREIPGFGLMTPKDQIAVRAQNMATERARLQQIAQDERQDARLRAQAEMQANSISAAMERLGLQIADRDERFRSMPLTVQTTDADGNPVTQFVRRGDVEQQLESGGGSPVQFGKPIPNAERLKTKEAANALQQINEAGALFKDEYVGPAAGRYYSMAEKFPDMGQVDPARSAFSAQNKTIMNATIKLITGAQMSEQEAQRILGQVPTVNDPPKVWRAKYEQTKKNAEMLMSIMRGGLPTGGLTPPPGSGGASRPKSDPMGLFE